MATLSHKSQSLEQFEQLEQLITQSEPGLAADMEVEVRTTGRESGIFELTQLRDEEELRAKREEEMEAEFFDLLKTLILELNDVKPDVRTPSGERHSPASGHVPGVERGGSQAISLTRDAATQTETWDKKKKKSKCTIL